MLTPNKTFTLLGSDGKPYSSTTPGTFGGHRGGKLYGRLDCRAALQAVARGGYCVARVFFADEAMAIAVGYRPCAVCMPQEYAAWKEARLPKVVLAVNHRPVRSARGFFCSGNLVNCRRAEAEMNER